MSSEFDLIRRYFAPCNSGRDDVVLGIGDDAAILEAPAGQQLVVSTDTLVAGVHFLPGVEPAALGHKSLAVNLSDLAAMGAEPGWATLALTLPAADEDWLARFCDGFCSLARDHRVALVGGDITRGPLSMTVGVHGFLPAGAALRRDAARPGELIHVTGTLGDAGLALRIGSPAPDGCRREDLAFLRARLERPTPRVREALQLRGLARSAIDVSDGLAADLGHILAASGVGATLWLEKLPSSAAFDACFPILDRGTAQPAGESSDDARAGLIAGCGDDYELCFTVAADAAPRLGQLSGGPYTCIGRIDAEPGLRLLRTDGSQFRPSASGYQHFAAVTESTPEQGARS